MMDAFLNKETCDRCGKKLSAMILSKMNEDIICMNCKDEERHHPLYPLADKAEFNAVKSGDYNYPGLFAGQKYPDFKIPILD